MVTNFIQRVRLALRKEGVTAAALARKAGLHRNTLYGADQPGWNPTAAVLIALEPHIDAIEPGEAVSSSNDYGAATKSPDNFGANIREQNGADNFGENIREEEADSHGPFSDSQSTCSTTPALSGPYSNPACSTGEAKAA